MNDERSFERFVADNVAGAAGSIRLPDDFYDDIHAFASRTRQRPEWLALIKEPPMRIDSTVSASGRRWPRLATIAATRLPSQWSWPVPSSPPRRRRRPRCTSVRRPSHRPRHPRPPIPWHPPT